MKNRFLLLLLFSVSILSAQKTYLHCGTIIDVETGKLLREKTIVVSGNKIEAVEDGYTQGGAADMVVDLKQKTVLPGFIDMHVHIDMHPGAAGGGTPRHMRAHNMYT